MKEIAITEIENIAIGQAEDTVAGTGCTVFISKSGMAAGLDIRGGGPASRESGLMDPLAAAQTIHAVVLSGGSAYGLGAADGVMQYLEENGIGLDVGVTKVPLVVQSDIFDLTVGDSKVRPDREMGYEAAKRALNSPNYRDGNFGAGCGATVGKICGMERCMKSGIGSYAIETGGLKIGAVVVVNAFGDIFDHRTGSKLAGLLNEGKNGFADTTEVMYSHIAPVENKFVSNTTIGIVMTNAKFDKTQLCKLAGMAHDGYARSIRPVHTSVDGDSIYAVSLGNVAADMDTVGVLSAEVMSEAITRAVKNADSAYGAISAKELKS
ncbi:MAG: P1 family peptidase [Ruminococcus sp.]|nr:P1 family peptidase [Ruminococcus sp.]